MLVRAFVFLLAGVIGLLIGEISAAFTLDHLTDLPGTFETIVAELNLATFVYCLCWPITASWHCLTEFPIFALVLLVVAVLCFYKIVSQDEPPMFWAILLMIVVASTPVISNGSLYSSIPFGLLLIAAGAGIFYFVHRDYPDWIEWFRNLNRQKEE